ncbi:MAG TPA: LacI family DNA-binding transcriptional regulator, partial [Opitutaceae bacterium]|nr:LacI family DNA-binding transcriptional regulator [Opitutaceae bacterium]
MPRPLPPNLRTIARKAGVSHTAVSLALRNDPSVSVATRTRIQKLANDLGYKPNALVSALMRQVQSKSRIVAQETIAYLSADRTADRWKRDPAFQRFMA